MGPLQICEPWAIARFAPILPLDPALVIVYTLYIVQYTIVYSTNTLYNCIVYNVYYVSYY